MIRLTGVSHTYGAGTPWSRVALTDVSLDIAPGEHVLVCGANGSGKSTLAWILAGLTAPTSGSATLDGRPLHASVRRVGIAFQHARLQLFRPTVAEDVAFGTDVDSAAVEVALSMVGLDPAAFAGRRVDELSGGETRRVAIAGLLARRPRLMVLDEPLAGLDAPSLAALLAALAAVEACTDAAVVVISHDVDGLDQLVSRVVRLDGGRVTADGTPSVVFEAEGGRP